MADLPRAFGHYVLLKSLGSGGTGDVHLARPAVPGTGIPSPVVIKRLHAQLAQQENFVRRFSHEAAIAVAVDSPHVAKAYDVGRVDETFYLALEYIPGWTLSRVMKDLEDGGGEASLESIADIVCGALAGLTALHEAKDPNTQQVLGVVHRDIAPKNIMVGEDGVTRLIDLGLGKSAIQDWKTSTGVVMGSPGYMAPEQVIAERVDHRADLFAVGIVLWELLTRRFFIKRAPLPLMLRAQSAPTLVAPSQYRSDVPPALDAVVLKSLAHDPDERYASAVEMAAAVRAAIPKRQTGGVATIVGDMLWGELGESKTEVTQLLQRGAPAGHIESNDVEVIAVREGVEATRAEAMPWGSPEISTPTPYAGSGVLAPPPRGISPVMVGALMALTLLGGIAGTLFFTQRSADVTVAPAVDVARPAIQARPTVSAGAPEEARPELPSATDTPPPRPAKKTRPRRREPVEAPPPVEPAEPAVPSMTALLGRARSLQKAHPDDPAVSKIVSRVMMEMQRREVPTADRRALEKSIRALERR